MRQIKILGLVENQLIRYSLTIFFILTTITVVTNVFSLIVVETYLLKFSSRIIVSLIEAVTTAIIITLIGINVMPVMREMMVTIRRLIRFDNLSHPLLIRLSQEAPATYHHSIMVANLAHKAAKAIKANPILTRVGAYYHDIGKLSKPTNFAENLTTTDNSANVHANLSPKESFVIILKHVYHGIAIAKEYHLPAEIINFISQHHGTSVAQFFYTTAKQAGGRVRKSEFRYPGPKPLTKETAIVMLADGIESKTRALPNLDHQSIVRAIDEIIAEKLDDDQLELSGLSARELAKIRRAFIDGLTVMSHRRVKYPKL